MKTDELMHYLETQRGSIPANEFFLLVSEMLENEITTETRDILESYLINYSYIDEDRVARYLERFLYDADPHAMTFVLPELGKLARKPDSLAERILEEFSENGIKKIEKIWRRLSLNEQTQSEEELDQMLTTDEQNLPESEFFELVFGMLEKDPSEDARDILKKYLLIHSSVDQDRVARYLERVLSDPDPLERELAARDLAVLAHEPSSLAYKILKKYLGEEPTADNKWKILNKRMIDLFPRDNSEEDR